jgi:hypothetical protein
LPVIPAERAAARESRNPGKPMNLDYRFRGNDDEDVTDYGVSASGFNPINPPLH